MNALRIILRQNQANYRKEESIDNKMTFPLPPFSTVIGALHSACGFTDYHQMDISIQGKYGSMQIEPYTDYAFLNSTMNDRGILVKLKNNKLLSTAYEVVAKANKSMGNDFEKEITIEIVNESLLREYQNLRHEKRLLDEQNKTFFKIKLAEFKDNIKVLKVKQKNENKKSDNYIDIQHKIDEITALKNNLEDEYISKKNSIDNEYSKFASLTTSLKYYEVLYDVELIIHIKSDNDTIESIKENIYNIRSIGRSEDFVDVISCNEVELNDEIDDEVVSDYSAYIRYENIKNDTVLMNAINEIPAKGTKYFMNKDYAIEKGKRIFNKKWVLYTERFYVDESCELGKLSNVYVDTDGYIVNFI